MRVFRVLIAASIAPLLLVGPTPTSSADPLAASTDAADLRGNESWSQVSTGEVSLLAQPTMLRTGDGVLHVVHAEEVGTQREYVHTSISGSGVVTGHSKVLAPWNTLLYDPQLVPAAGGGMRLVFSGLQDIDSANFFSRGHLYNALSDATGSTWSVPAEGLTRSSSGYASYGTAAAVLPDLTPIQGFVLNSALTWRTGTIPAAALAPGNTTPADPVLTQSQCCAYHTSMAQSGGNVWAAWYGNGHTGDSEGVLVRQIHPAVGPLMVAPSSNRPTGSEFDSYAPSQSVPLGVRPDGSTVAAYCVGTFACESLMVWQVGTGTLAAVPGGKGATHVAMDVAPSGRLWVTYTKNDRVYAVRSAPSGLKFGAVRAVGAPSGTSTIYRIEVEATDAAADIVVNDGDRLSHIRIEPAMGFKATPRRWDGDRVQVVTFKVTDATGGVSGAKVRAAGERCRTNGAGKCSIRFTPRGAGRILAKATKSGYLPAAVKLKVKP